MKSLITLIFFFTALYSSATPVDSTLALKYIIRQPKLKSAHPPMLIMLHGFGSNEEGLLSYANQLPEKYLVICARAPFSIGEKKFAWFKLDLSTGIPVFSMQEEEKSKKIIIKFIGQLKKRYYVNNIYLCGISQGAIMSYSVALTHPGLIKGIAIMSGWLPDEIKPHVASKEKLRDLKIYISHGTEDNTLPYANATNAIIYLKSLGLNPTFNHYKARHEITDLMISDLAIWLK